MNNERIGIIKNNNFGSLMALVKYNKSDDILVKFLENGNIKQSTWYQFSVGSVKNPYDKSVYGVGYLGEGKYKVKENRKHTLQYNTWHDMVKRCYSDKFQEKYPTYKGCSVVEEWHNFQTFAKWMDDNYYNIKGERIEIDKDILVKGNKLYSSETCVFVPKNINLLFLKQETKRGEFPIGVYYDKTRGKFEAKCMTIDGKYKIIGRFSNQNDAFNAYKIFKEELILDVAEKYKNQIPKKLYDVMINYVVKMTD